MEKTIQRDLIRFLEDRGWHVERLIGNAWQSGIPDLNACHLRHGERWIDVKRPLGWSLTKAQKLKWPVWEKYGRGVWILTAADGANYRKLFGPPNWRDYWRAADALPDVDKLLQEMRIDGNSM